MKVLIVVDMQNDFIDGSLGTKEAKAIVPRVVEKINNWYGDIYYTQDTHYPNYLTTKEGKQLPIKHCIKDTNGWELNTEIKSAIVKKDCICNQVLKETFGSVDTLPKMIMLNHNDDEITEIQLVGLCTGICVAANVSILKSYFYDTTDITVDASCCACVTPESHKIALEAMKLQQINVINE